MLGIPKSELVWYLFDGILSYFKSLSWSRVNNGFGNSWNKFADILAANKGNGIKVVNHLINEAKKLNIKRLSLETGAGDFFLPARKLFLTCNFRVCGPFSHYVDDVNSVYMDLLISN